MFLQKRESKSKLKTYFNGTKIVEWGLVWFDQINQSNNEINVSNLFTYKVF